MEKPAQFRVETNSVELVAGSLGQWQANGHLGDTLKAMRGAFTRAKKAAPAILFIDELDSFGDRTKFAGDNRDYSTQVVNALLEQIDGVEGRDGVVVIGATNNVGQIDRAILRSGRLDRHIEIGLPNGADRMAILAEHLQCGVTATELEVLKVATNDMSGADLAKAAREARRIARLARRAVTVDDVRASLPPVMQIEGELRRYIAIHESGHTIVGTHLGHGIYLGTEIASVVNPQATNLRGGAAYFDMPSFVRRDRQYHLDQITVMVAGLAAEELILGCFADGGASDLAAATRIATLMEARYGMGQTLRHSAVIEDEALERLRQLDRPLAERVHRTLQDQFDRAKAILSQRMSFLDVVTQELFEIGALTPKRLDELLGQCERLKESKRAPGRSRASPDRLQSG
ncbi:AAA family ATPase [Rhizobium sp. CECT 9324]|uniref:AAA family ATPase n=1 Tax=Rhizobium sp. CECT 9324 TaxID=2845820 RepID=UPI001E62074E|nr:AAA family ATPase [Rhizobium sp. CECT 9324]CAH0340497.1 ATP-dependent zinc metalloprotease FtsH [Rhizobium sp. CECT 9324]